MPIFKGFISAASYGEVGGEGDGRGSQVRRPSEGPRAGAARQRIADAAACRPGRRPTDYASQPCASWTATIAARILFQVAGCIITSLGNMQPSQQMCLIVVSTSPCSSRSQ